MKQILKVGCISSNEVLTKIVAAYLGSSCYVSIFKQTTDLLEEARAGNLDVILIDRSLPGGLTAEDLVRNVREKKDLDHIPLIVMTASEELRWQEPRFKPDFVLPKPFTQELLLEVIFQFARLKEEERLDRRKILIVDDSPSARKILAQTFNLDGHFEVLEAETAGEAKKLILQHEDELKFITLDLHLPDRTGLELTSELRRKGIFTPIIMITSDLKEDFLKEAFLRGVNLYILKKDISEERVRVYSKEFLQLEADRKEKEQLPVLIVEDNSIFREVLIKHFALRGFPALAVASAEEALKLLRLNRFLLTIIDINLPGMNGIEFLQQIQALNIEEYEKLTLVYTASPNPFLVFDAFMAGATDFLQAPFGFHEFHIRVFNLLRLRNTLLNLVRAKESYYHLSIVDHLTGLYNRRYFWETLERSLKEARRYGHDISLILIDLDNFKQINDQYGHQVGDELLKIVAEGLRSSVRATDLVARYGGDEFVILLPRENVHRCKDLLERLRQKLKSCRLEKYPSIEVEFSMGVASFSEIREQSNQGETFSLPDSLPEADALLRLADMRMYDDKRRKKADPSG
jgi:diguanylate cyclase (GGDEF)-like protein